MKTVKNFEAFIGSCRREFRRLLETNRSTSVIEKNLTKWFNVCSGEFEERIFIESLKNEYGEFIKGLNKGE